MSRFDPASLMPESETSPVQAGRAGGFTQTTLAGFRGLLESLGETLSAPGFGRVAIPALGILAVIVASLWWAGLPGSRSSERDAESGRVAERPAALPESAMPPPEARAVPEEGPLLVEERPDPVSRRAESPESLAPPPTRGDSIQQGRAPEPEQLAEHRRAPHRADPEPGPDSPASEATEAPPGQPREEILLAALGDLGLPSYTTPIGGGSVTWMDRYGGLRSGTHAPILATRAPEAHVGLTLSTSPRLWWSLDKATELPIQITVSYKDAIEPLLRVEFPGPHAAGLHSIDLAERDLRLSPETDYRWFVSLLVDPDRTARNPVATGALRVVDASDPRHEIVAGSAAAERGHRLAAQGLWYDAFDFFASLAQANPDSDSVAAHRDRLTDLVKRSP